MMAVAVSPFEQGELAAKMTVKILDGGVSPKSEGGGGGVLPNPDGGGGGGVETTGGDAGTGGAASNNPFNLYNAVGSPGTDTTLSGSTTGSIFSLPVY
jgi:hypothetical protein